MNEQLIVKNFGPIKDATVDFKRVTVFIGPTGGGKSTLAKLAAILLGGKVTIVNSILSIDEELTKLSIINYKTPESFLQWHKESGNNFVIDRPMLFPKQEEAVDKDDVTEELIEKLVNRLVKQSKLGKMAKNAFRDAIIKQIAGNYLSSRKESENKICVVQYTPSNRALVPAVEYSWAGLLRDDIGLPKDTLDFANDFSLSRKEVPELDIPFLDAKYLHRNGQDFIQVPGVETLFRLYETASGIQSVTPMMVLLEHLSRNTEQAQSFIIEEPELNLYPTAQQGLLNWLVEKCTKGENDLTITTHSPYLLAHFNTLLFAYQVAHTHPERADEVAKVVPRESWINPQEFAVYHVEGQQENGVRSIVNPDTGLISYNGLDAIASAAAIEFEKLLDINAGLEVE